jgi:hypothetical protein
LESGRFPREVGAESVIVVVFGFVVGCWLVLPPNNLFRQPGVLAQLAIISKR